MNGEVWCPRSHRLLRSEAMWCGAGHEHLVYRCPMRVGSRRCGEVVVVPPYNDACEAESE